MNIALAEKVKKAILAEPDRVWMSPIWTRVTSGKKAIDKRLKLLHCGAVGCIAGHTLHQSKVKFDPSALGVLDKAQELLEISSYEARGLFFAHIPGYAGCNDYTDIAQGLAKAKPGSKPYAKLVAKAIDRCIERNRGEGA